MNRIRETREKKGISQFELARRTGLHPSTISKVERGVWMPFPGWRRRIAEALEVGENEIFPEEK